MTATEWGPGHKKTASGHIMGIWTKDKLFKGKVWWAECTDGWTGAEREDQSEAQRDYGEHFSKQHGGK